MKAAVINAPNDCAFRPCVRSPTAQRSLRRRDAALRC